MPDTRADYTIAENNYTNTIKDLIGECMQEQDFEYVSQHSDPNEYVEALGLGLPRDEYARQIGFGFSRSALASRVFDSRNDSAQDRELSYLDSLAPDDLEAYEKELGDDPSLDSLGSAPAGSSNGCIAEAYSSIKTPPWIAYSHWLKEVRNELSQQVQADQRLKIFDQR